MWIRYLEIARPNLNPFNRWFKPEVSPMCKINPVRSFCGFIRNLLFEILFFHKKKEDMMTISQSIFPSPYPNGWPPAVQSSNLAFLFPPHDHGNLDSESIRTLFAPSAGAFYVHQPSKRRPALNKAIECLVWSAPDALHRLGSGLL